MPTPEVDDTKVELFMTNLSKAVARAKRRHRQPESDDVALIFLEGVEWALGPEGSADIWKDK